jgi:hypothetical protein
MFWNSISQCFVLILLAIIKSRLVENYLPWFTTAKNVGKPVEMTIYGQASVPSLLPLEYIGGY